MIISMFVLEVMYIIFKIINILLYKSIPKLEPLCVDDWNIKWCSCCGKQYDGSSEKLNLELSYDSEILFLCIVPK